MPAGAVCTIEVELTSAVAGTHVNTTSQLSSSLGASGTASDTLTVLGRTVGEDVGLDADAVNAAFTAFTHAHLELTAQQIRFISMLKAHICANGGLEIERLYEAPFTTLSAEGIDGVFDDMLIDELLDLIAQFNLPEIQGMTA